jgi:hypothetical protein
VDLEQFYDEDPRRRASEELEFGRDWTDEANNRCEISWVEATGELYAMREPLVEYEADGLGGMYAPSPKVEQLWIDVIGIVSGREAIEAVMSGWENAMPGANSLEWVRVRVANVATEMNDMPANPSDDLPSH